MSMKCVLICSRYKAADPDPWASVARETADIEIADGRPICREGRITRVDARTRSRVYTCIRA